MADTAAPVKRSVLFPETRKCNSRIYICQTEHALPSSVATVVAHAMMQEQLPSRRAIRAAPDVCLLNLDDNARAKEWFDVLATCLKFACLRRLRAVCRILVQNDLMEWPQLQFASDPDEWEDAEMLTIDEVEFLRNFMREGKRAPRYLSHSLIGICGLHQIQVATARGASQGCRNGRVERHCGEEGSVRDSEWRRPCGSTQENAPRRTNAGRKICLD